MPDKKARKSRSKSSPKNPTQAANKKRGKNQQDSGVKIGEAPRVKRKYTRRSFGGKSRKQSAEVESRNEPIAEEKKVEEKITESEGRKEIVADDKGQFLKFLFFKFMIPSFFILFYINGKVYLKW